MAFALYTLSLLTMKHSIEKLENSQIKINIRLTSEEFQKILEKETNDFARDIELSGFRKGRAPIEIIKKSLTK